MSTCDKETFLVAGGAGFHRVNFVKYLLAHRSARVLVLDALTYAGNASSLAEEMENGSIEFFKADIADYDTVESILRNESAPQYIGQFCGRNTCRPQRRRSASVYRHQCGRGIHHA